MLADMAIGIETARLVMYKSAWETDQGLRNSYMASIGKCYASGKKKYFITSLTKRSLVLKKYLLY